MNQKKYTISVGGSPAGAGVSVAAWAVSSGVSADTDFFKKFEDKSTQLEDDVSKLFLILNYLA